MEAKAFEAAHCLRRNGKLQVRAGGDGFCVFFRAGLGCSVHPARPDICRAWPYFRGNLLDAQSHALAAGYCTGLDKDQPHEDFLAEGLRYLKEGGLCGTGGIDEAGALQVADLAARARKG
jgi:Fe-S-cluster containining protein